MGAIFINDGLIGETVSATGLPSKCGQRSAIMVVWLFIMMASYANHAAMPLHRPQSAMASVPRSCSRERLWASSR